MPRPAADAEQFRRLTELFDAKYEQWEGKLPACREDRDLTALEALFKLTHRSVRNRFSAYKRRREARQADPAHLEADDTYKQGLAARLGFVAGGTWDHIVAEAGNGVREGADPAVTRFGGRAALDRLDTLLAPGEVQRALCNRVDQVLGLVVQHRVSTSLALEAADHRLQTTLMDTRAALARDHWAPLAHSRCGPEPHRGWDVLLLRAVDVALYTVICCRLAGGGPALEMPSQIPDPEPGDCQAQLVYYLTGWVLRKTHALASCALMELERDPGLVPRDDPEAYR